MYQNPSQLRLLHSFCQAERPLLLLVVPAGISIAELAIAIPVSG
jgi:hypothetical protein